MIKCKWCDNELKTSLIYNRLRCDHCNRLVNKTGDKEYYDN